MYLAALRRLNHSSCFKIARPIFVKRQFSNENVDFMEKFARPSFQNNNIRQNDQGKAFQAKKKQRQPAEETSDVVSQAYIREFGKLKGDLLQDWLQMSHDDLVLQCRKLEVNVSEKLNENIQGLFDYLNQFESNALTNAQGPSPVTPHIDGVFKKFGMKKQEQMDKWLDLPNSELMAECQKYGLTVSEKHIHNIQSLFNYLKSFDTPAAKPKIQNAKSSIEKTDYQENQSKQFHRKISDKQNWDQQAQSEAAISEVEADLSKIFNRKIKAEQNKINSKSQPTQTEDKRSGPLLKLPLAQSFVGALQRKLQSKPSSFADVHVPSGTSDRLMALQQTDFVDQVAAQQKKHDLVDTVFQMSPEMLVQQLESMQGAQQIENFKALSNTQKRTTLLNLAAVNLLKAEIDPDLKLLRLIQNKENLLPFAFENYSVLNASSRTQVRQQIVNLLQLQEKEKVVQELLTVKHLNAFAQLNAKLGFGGSKESNQFFSDLIDTNGQVFKVNHLLSLLPQLCDLSCAVESIISQSKGGIDSHLLLTSVQHQFRTVNTDVLVPEFTKGNLQQLSVNQISKLIYLCSSNKQLEPLLKYFSCSEQLAELSNDKLIFIIERSIDLNNKSVLSSIMDGFRMQVSPLRFDLTEIKKLAEQIARLGPVADLQLLGSFLQSNVKQIYSVTTAKELSQTLDLLMLVYNSQPQEFKSIRFQLRHLINSTAQLMKREIIPLREMVRMATFLIPNIAKPVFMLDQIIVSKESLSKDVPENEVHDLVDAILSRAQQHRISFDHLKHSSSVIHSEFVPYAGVTFQLLRKVMDDNVSCDITNRILADSFIASRLFSQTDQAEISCRTHLQRQIQELKNVNKLKVSTLQNILHMIANFNQIAPTEEIHNLSSQIFSLTLQKLKDFGESFDGVSQFQSLLTTNAAVMQALDSFKNCEELLGQYRSQLWLAQTLEECLRQKLKLPKLKQDSQSLMSPQIEDKIFGSLKTLSWSQLERHASHLLKHFLVHLNSQQFTTPELSQLVHQYLLRIQNSRSLHNDDLTNLFQLVNKLQPTLKHKGDFDLLLLNVASNLRTIGVKLMYQNSEDDQDTNNPLKNQNASILEEDRQLKKLILDQYNQIYERNPALFTEHKFSLAPLSNLMAQLFDSFEHQDVLKCMNLLSGSNIDNYSEEFIVKLYENYAQQAFMAQMYDQNPKFFFEFSKAWPRFLRNNAILNQLTRVKGQSILVSDQSETLQILTRRNVLHPELMNMHLDTFIRMKDREQVSKYLKQFLESAAYFGYTNDVNIEQITQVFRRIHRSPAECDMEELLNFLVVLAVSKTYYEDFDEKSKLFIDQALDIVENSTISQKYISQTQNKQGVKYSGTQHLIATRPKDLKQDSSGNKQADSLETDQEFQLSFFQQIPTSVKTYNKQAVNNTTRKISEETERVRNAYFQSDTTSLSDVEENEESQSIDAAEVKIIDIQEEDEEAGSDGDSSILLQKSTRKSYERKGSESQYQEDFEYLQYRNKKLAQMNKKDKHLLVYSNINQLNFVDINQQAVAKAWTILFHFRAKSLQSMLFEEFNSISQRNAVGKTKSHDLFNKLYLKLMEESHENGYLIQMANSCDRTGWPIDISLRSKEPKTGKTEQHAIYFMLQEELCYNAQTQTEEPLGLQKLMVRHLQTISDYKVHFVTENEAQSGLDSVVDRLLEKMSE